MQTVPWFDSFRRNIEKTLKKNGVSQAELSRRSGIHFTTINRILRGHVDPSLTTAERLAVAAGMSAESAFRENFSESKKTQLTRA